MELLRTLTNDKTVPKEHYLSPNDKHIGYWGVSDPVFATIYDETTINYL